MTTTTTDERRKQKQKKHSSLFSLSLSFLTTTQARNYRFFLLFVSSATALCVAVQVICWARLARLARGSGKKPGEEPPTDIGTAVGAEPAALVLALYCFFGFWFVGGLSGFHAVLASKNTTTYEHFRGKGNRVRNGSGGGKRTNPYDRGFFGNWFETCLSALPARNREKLPEMEAAEAMVTARAWLEGAAAEGGGANGGGAEARRESLREFFGTGGGGGAAAAAAGGGGGGVELAPTTATTTAAAAANAAVLPREEDPAGAIAAEEAKKAKEKKPAEEETASSPPSAAAVAPEPATATAACSWKTPPASPVSCATPQR